MAAANQQRDLCITVYTADYFQINHLFSFLVSIVESRVNFIGKGLIFSAEVYTKKLPSGSK